MHKKKDFSKAIVISAVIAVVGYTCASFYMNFHDTTLTASWFAFWAVELAALAGIEINKNKGA